MARQFVETGAEVDHALGVRSRCVLCDVPGEEMEVMEDVAIDLDG